MPPPTAKVQVGARHPSVQMVTRRFLVVGHTQTTDPDLSLNDLAGMGGRLDVLCRVVTSALCTSHGVREDTEVWCVIDHDEVQDAPLTVRFNGAEVRNLNPDERTTAALFKRAFGADVVDNGHFENAHPGVTVGWLGFADALRRFAQDGPVLFLDKDGVDIRQTEDGVLGTSQDDPVGLVLSDHVPFSDAERAVIDDLSFTAVSVGPEWLQGHSVVTLVHDELDRRTRR